MEKMLFAYLVLFASLTQLDASRNHVEAFLHDVLLGDPEVSSLLIQIYWNLPQTECVNQIMSVFENITKGDLEAIKMVDASAKPQAGILYGNVMHMGNFDECLRVNGKYCTVPFIPHPQFGEALNQTLADFFESAHLVQAPFEFDPRQSYGLCFPKICNSSDLQSIFDVLEDAFQFPAHFIFEEKKCAVQEAPLTISAAVAIGIFSFFFVLVLCSTLYDVFFRISEKESLYASFSIKTNFKNLFSSTLQDDLKCLNGMGVLSMMWLLVTHRIVYLFSTPNINIKHILYWRFKFVNIFFLAGDIATDTLLTISGLLVVYLFKEKMKFSVLKYYASKLLRIVPSLVMAVLLTATLLKYLGNGPFWWTVEESQERCEKHWWATLLYLQNYLYPEPEKMCMTHSWYLAVDAQMYLLAPLILLPLMRWSQVTIFALISLILISCGFAFAVSVYNELPTSLVEVDYRMLWYLYLPTHVRGVSYLVGMVCGYYLLQMRSAPLKLHKWEICTLWLGSLLILLGIIAGHLICIAFDLSLYKSAAFNSCIRVGWSFAVSVVIVLCASGNGGLINSFLSHGVFAFLARLNYNVFILHEITLMLVSGQLRTPNFFSNLFAFHNFWGDYIFTLSMALIWTLAFESPMIALLKHFKLEM